MAIDKFVIGFSVGIGESIAEAEAALFKAKERKNKELKSSKKSADSARENPPHYIGVYGGEPLPEKIEKIDPAVEKYLKLLRSMEKKNPEGIPLLDELVKTDFNTTALTSVGYRIEKHQRDLEFEKIRKPRKKRRYVILLDGNNMKYYNQKAGYEKVSKRLNAAGKAIVDGCRTRKNGYSDFVAKVAPLVNRMHNDAGDEFLVDLYTPKKYVVGIAERLIKAAYKAQREIKG